MKISFNIYITTSKLAAYLILIIGTIFAFVYNNSEVIIFTFSLSAGLLGLKTWSEGLTRRHMDRNRRNEYIYDRESYDYQKPIEEIG